MTNFQFFSRNQIRTLSQLSATSANANISQVFDRKENIQWQTSGQNSDLNTMTLYWTPGSSTNVSCVMLQNHNFKDFDITYNSGTALSPALNVTGNTNSNTFYFFATQSVNNIQINCLKTHVADAEKAIGQIVICDLKLTLDTNPQASGYNPFTYKKGIEYELADGGVTSVYLSDKFRTELQLGFIASSTYDSLFSLWNEHKDFTFVPFPVNTYTTFWDGQSYAVNWTGDFTLMQLRDNVLNGYRGNMRLSQIPD